MFDKKVIVIAGGVFLGILYFINTGTDTENIVLKENSVQKEQHEEVVTVKSYKDVFKEAKEIGFVEKLQDEENIKNIEKESQKIIADAEALIKKHNLVLPKQTLTKAQVKDLETFDKELEDMKSQLEELRDEV